MLKMSKQIKILLLLILFPSIIFAQTYENKINYRFPQNINYPVVYDTYCELEYVYRDTISIDDESLFKTQIFTRGGVVLKQFILGDSLDIRYSIPNGYKKVTKILAENSIDLGLYNRDKAKTCFITGACMYGLGLLLNTGGIIATYSNKPDYRAALILNSISSAPYFVGSSCFIAGFVFQTRANRCFLVGCSNYGISTTYKF